MERKARFSRMFRVVQALPAVALMLPVTWFAWLVWSSREVQRVPIRASLPIARWVPSVSSRDAVQITIDAPPEVVWDMLWRTDWRTGSALEAALFLRELPRHLRVGDAPIQRPRTVTLDTLIARGVITILEGEPGRRVVLGSIGQPWRGDWGARPIARDSFTKFRESEHVRMVWSVDVAPAPDHRSVLTIEWRSQPVDEAARSRFDRYWMVARPFVTLLAKTGLRRYAGEASAAAAARGGASAAALPAPITSAE